MYLILEDQFVFEIFKKIYNFKKLYPTTADLNIAQAINVLLYCQVLKITCPTLNCLPKNGLSVTTSREFTREREKWFAQKWIVKRFVFLIRVYDDPVCDANNELRRKCNLTVKKPLGQFWNNFERDNYFVYS